MEKKSKRKDKETDNIDDNLKWFKDLEEVDRWAEGIDKIFAKLGDDFDQNLK